jgi:uncharacterized membrane protein YbhN (UPF0104 family)
LLRRKLVREPILDNDIFRHQRSMNLRELQSRLKPHLRWAIVGVTAIFLGKALATHWQEVVDIPISLSGWGVIAAATGVTLLAHIWSGWVWTWVLQEFNQSVPEIWTVQVYLKTNLGKYLPGNVWHFYGRIRSLIAVKVPFNVAVLSVVLEPLLMAAAALAIAIACGQLAYWPLQVIGLGIVLAVLHPAILNPVAARLSTLKLRKSDELPASSPSTQPEFSRLGRYPLRPLVGQMGFFGLRSTGFLLVVLAMSPVEWQQLATLVSGFGLAWFLGLVVPSPGGLGVFESTAVALLSVHFSAALLLKVVAIYRLVSILSEVAGAGLASLRYPHPFNPPLR